MLTFTNSIKALCLITTVAVAPMAAKAETLVRSTVESRLLLGFKVDDAAAQAWLPEGWAPLTLPKGPLAGTNMIVSFMDRHVILDPEGKTDTPASNRAVALLSYAVSPDVKGPRAFITRIWETPPVVNPYSNSLPAVISRSASSDGSGEAAGQRSESWNVAPEGGGTMTVTLNYESGPKVFSPGQESLPYSAADPEYHEIYRYDQLAELVSNSQIGKPLKGDIAFSTDIAELAPMLDGAVTPVAIVSIPVYVRQVYLL